MTCTGSCAYCLKANYSLFSELNQDELELLDFGREKAYYKKGDILFHQGDVPTELICLNQGKVKLVREGKIEDEFILDFKKPVDFVGFADLMSQEKFSSTAISLDESSTCSIKKENLLAVMKTNPEFSLKIVRYLANEIKSFKDKMVHLTQGQIDSRLAGTILNLVSFFGYGKDNTIAVELKRKEIAAISNMNTANAIRTLSKFQKNSLIEMNKRAIRVLDEEGIKALAIK